MIVVAKEAREAVVVMVVAVMVVVTVAEVMVVVMVVTVAEVMVAVAVMVVATDHQCKCMRQPVRSAEKIVKFLLDPAIPSRFFVRTASRAKIVIPIAADQVEAEILTGVIPKVVEVVGEEVIATIKCMMQFVAIAVEIAKYRSNLPVTSRFIAISVLEGIKI